MISIGTNFNYQGNYFLDDRQKVEYRSDLEIWSTPIPVGFEVYCKQEDLWYVYLPDTSGAYTYSIGSFVPRWEYEYNKSSLPDTFNSIDNRFIPLEDYVYDRYELKITNLVGTKKFLEVGTNNYNPYFTWNVYDFLGDEVTDAYTTRVLGYKKEGNLEVLFSDHTVDRKDFADSVINFDARYELKSTLRDPSGNIRQSNTLNIYVKFVPKRYLLLSQNPVLSDPREITDNYLYSDLTDDINLEYTVDCRPFEISGGAYIHYLVPKSQIDSINDLSLAISGIVTSAINVNSFTIINSKSVSVDYWDVCLQYKQNEQLNLSFKYNK